MSTKGTIFISEQGDWLEYDMEGFSFEDTKPFPILINVSTEHSEIIEGEYPDHITLSIGPGSGLYEVLNNLYNYGKKAMIPTNEEIMEEAVRLKEAINKLPFHDASFQLGAQWMRSKLTSPENKEDK